MRPITGVAIRLVRKTRLPTTGTVPDGGAWSCWALPGTSAAMDPFGVNWLNTIARRITNLWASMRSPGLMGVAVLLTLVPHHTLEPNNMHQRHPQPNMKTEED